MSAMEWAMGLTIYFVLTAVVVALFSAAGAFSVTEGISVTGTGSGSVQGLSNSTLTGHAADTSFSISKMMKDLFSFFFFNISITSADGTLVTYMWVLRIFLVYLPAVFLAYTVWYSMPTVGGG